MATKNELPFEQMSKLPQPLVCWSSYHVCSFGHRAPLAFSNEGPNEEEPPAGPADRCAANSSSCSKAAIAASAFPDELPYSSCWSRRARVASSCSRCSDGAGLSTSESLSRSMAEVVDTPSSFGFRRFATGTEEGDWSCGDSSPAGRAGVASCETATSRSSRSWRS